MSTELRNFLSLSYDELEQLNLRAKEQRRNRVAEQFQQLRRVMVGIPVGSSTGAVARRLILGLYPGFPPSCPFRTCRGPGWDGARARQL